MIGKYTYKYIVAALFSMFALASCIKQTPVVVGGPDDELASIQVGVSTRAGEVGPSTDYVGRDRFADQDRIVFKTIKRKENSIAAFTYTDIEFVASVKTENGKESIGWSRDKTKGHSGTSETNPDRIYWSDATNPHIFIGYCAPQPLAEFDWTLVGGVYNGTLGVQGETGTLDFKTGGNDLLRKNDILLTYSDAVKADDAIAKLQFYHGLAQVRVIVNISEFAVGGGRDKQSVVSDMILKEMPTEYTWSQNGVATVAKAESALRDVNLWIPNPEGVGADASKTFTFYGLAVPREISGLESLDFSFTVTYPDAMDPTHTHTVSHTYNASISGITFTSGQCTTINISLNHQNEKITVGAEYDDWEYVESIDEGALQKHNIFLNTLARNKTSDPTKPGVTILGDPLANADDATWLYFAFDEESQHVEIRDIYGNRGTYDNPFQIKDAEQLLSLAYEVSGLNRASGTFEYWTPRSKTYPGERDDHEPVQRTLPAAGNFDFSGYYIALEAGLYLQPTKEATSIEWPGIGVYVGHQAAGNKPFNGRLFGGVRVIKRLKGNALFNYIGPEGHVDQLILEDLISISANAGFVELNEGVVCASKVGSLLAKNSLFDITGNKKFKGGTDATVATTAPEAVYVGPFCACNNGVIIECYSTARFRATNADRVSNLVGLNNGLILCSFAAGTVQATKAEAQIYGIMAGMGEVEFNVDMTGDKCNDWTHTGTMKNVGETIFCLYDRTENTHTVTKPYEGSDPLPDYMQVQGTIYNVQTTQYEVVPGTYALTTAMLQGRSIVGNHITNIDTGENDPSVLRNTLNGALYIWLKHPENWPPHFHHVYRQIYPSDQIIQRHILDRYYEYHVAAYPWVY